MTKQKAWGWQGGRGGHGRGGGGGAGGRRGRGGHFDGRAPKRAREGDEEDRAASAGDSGAAANGEWKWSKTDALTYRSAPYEKYYKRQGVVPEAEWDAFLLAWSKPLPVTFRVNPTAPDAGAARATLESHPEWSLPFKCGDGSSLPAPRRLSFLSDAWQLGYSKTDLKRNASLKSFHEWLVARTATGTISRQEAVSMIPPLLLDVQPHHFVLDMCAAPGSKTAQLLEALHAPEALTPGAPPASGFIVANDADAKRAYLLTHQCARLGSHALLVACHDAQLFPNLLRGKPEDSPVELNAEAIAARRLAARAKRLAGCFDRVLADVPCSGDGTGRKNADVFRKWSPSAALALHPLQIQIAMRGLSLLKVGGMLAYSTCSLNPIEDEAVVAELLRRCEGSVELVDVSSQLPGLVRSPGISSWVVFDKDMGEWSDFPSTQAMNTFGHYPKAGKRLTQSMFPPSPELAAALHLDRCLRVLPHTGDTGGFFISLFRKTAPLASSAPWFDPSAPASSVARAVDSEDEVDNAYVRPFYGRATDPNAPAAPVRPAAAAFSVALAANEGKEEVKEAEEAAEDEEHTAPEQEENEEEADAEARVEAEAEAEAEAEEEAEKAEPAGGLGGASNAASGDKIAEKIISNEPGAPPASSSTRHQGGVQRWVPKKMRPDGTEPESSGVAPTRDSKGRSLQGRFELTAYIPLAESSLSDITRSFGLRAPFPGHLLRVRSDGGKNITLVSESIASTVLAQQRDPALGTGRVKVINAGIKVFAEIKEKGEAVRAAGGASSDANATAASALALAPPAPFRLLQGGVGFLLPYMTRAILHVTGQEMLALLRFRGQFVSSSVFSPRIHAALTLAPQGSLVCVVNPALDGLEGTCAGAAEEGAAACLAALRLASSSIGSLRLAPPAGTYEHADADGACVPRARVDASSINAIAPALLSHYVPAKDGSSDVIFTPGERAFPGTNPLARAFLCLWKGRQKLNLMVDTEEGKAVEALLIDAGYKQTAAVTTSSAPVASE